MAFTGGFGEFAVQGNNRLLRKARPYPGFQLWGEVDFRHQQQGLLAECEGAFDQTQIDLGLAAAGHAEQQVGHEAAVDVDGVDHCRLFGGQLWPGLRCRRSLRAARASLRWCQTFQASR